MILCKKYCGNDWHKWAARHTTLWNGSKFLDDTNYLNDKTFEVFVRELCFFELK